MEGMTDMVQLIDGDGVWSETLIPKFREWAFLNKGFNYWTVSILGAQSSGKSTLLNLLFGTHFPVMHAEEGRSQTTKGIWMGKAEDKTASGIYDILVLDVEGTDGREREEQKSFEKKSSLFSLALAEILIINMWTNDVGRYHGANIGLLKTIFELNLQLFAPEVVKKTDSHQAKGHKNEPPKVSKTLLLFILRDHAKAVTPLQRLQDTLMKDLNKIWAEIQKPDNLKTSNLTDFFDFDFTSLSNKEFQPEDFKADVEQLKTRFFESANPDAQTAKERIFFNNSLKKDVPADGWAIYAEKIWEVISESKDLDLPTQKELLAMFRCDEISAQSFNRYLELIKPVKSYLEQRRSLETERDVNENFYPNFGAEVRKIYDTVFDEFDEVSKRYFKDVVNKKREELRIKVIAEIQLLLAVQLDKIKESASRLLSIKVSDLVPKNEKEVVKNFGAQIAKIETLVLNFYRDNKNKSLLEGVEDNTAASRAIEEELLAKIEKVKENMRTRLTSYQEEKFRQAILPPLNRVLEAGEDSMWDKIRKLYEVETEKSKVELENELKSFTPTKSANEQVSAFNRQLYKALRDRMIEKKDNILYVMEKKFNEIFKLDERGFPRRWKPEDNVMGLLSEGRTQSEKILDLYSIIRLDPDRSNLTYLKEEPDQPYPEEVVLSIDDFSAAKSRFKKETDAAYLEAVRDQENAGALTKVPFPMIVLMCVLGFNEFWMLITNPLLLVLAIILGVIGYVVYFLGFADVPLQIGGELLNQGLASVKGAVVQAAVKHVMGGGAQRASEDKVKSD
eukprot:TRINITY_DN11299_c0_g1_i1.p1 TRINITY_DN11299_c0_g1~~TRINITY_DN11299_c0_g1_i1.p1  ORF type:complete len:805 (+),score=234.74 TRINITY_DN11299_c0_g1_i1:47-2416(+)